MARSRLFSGLRKAEMSIQKKLTLGVASPVPAYTGGPHGLGLAPSSLDSSPMVRCSGRTGWLRDMEQKTVLAKEVRIKAAQKRFSTSSEVLQTRAEGTYSYK